jgi:hypothetical protein
MRGAVVYESMFGATRAIAVAIAMGLEVSMDMKVINAGEASEADLADLDLVVIGAPTHAHGMPRPTTRNDAPNYTEKKGNHLTLEARANSYTGVREWLNALGEVRMQGAAFDTRVKGASVITGRASRGIARTMESQHLVLVSPPESFLVDTHSNLLAGEVKRAAAWGERLGTLVLLNLAGSAN